MVFIASPMAFDALAQAVDHGGVRSAQAELDRDLPAGGVGHQLGDRESRDLVGALFEQPGVLDLELLEAADPRADHHAAAVMSSLEKSSPESRTASIAATIANWVKRSSRLASLGAM